MQKTFDAWEGTCLAHHGIKGQKWGVRRFRNPDGSLTEAGKKHQQKKLSNYITRTKGGSNEKLRKNPQVENAIKSLEESSKKLGKAQNELYRFERDWYSGKNPEYNKYTQKLAEKFSRDHGNSVEVFLDLIRNDDLDQGDSFQLYLKDHKKVADRYKKALSNETAAYKEHQDAIKKATEELLGEYGDRKYTDSFGLGIHYTTSASKRLEGLLYSESMRNRQDGPLFQSPSDYLDY